jgi:hypothetical protein
VDVEHDGCWLIRRSGIKIQNLPRMLAIGIVLQRLYFSSAWGAPTTKQNQTSDESLHEVVSFNEVDGGLLAEAAP